MSNNENYITLTLCLQSILVIFKLKGLHDKREHLYDKVA